MSQAHSSSGAPPVRASDAERDQVAEHLRTGYSEGRLSRTEFDKRLAAAYAAKTHADLRDLISDLPGTVFASPASDRPASDRQASTLLPVLHPDPHCGPGMQFNRCLLLCLLFAFPPAGIVYWILTACRGRPPGSGPKR